MALDSARTRSRPRSAPAGSGEVWRATDINLARQVAIKILPEPFADDPERLARLEREARTLASLNHPNIAQIYGLERLPASAFAEATANRHAESRAGALVMELVEGATLADLIAVSRDRGLPVVRRYRLHARSPTRSTPHTSAESCTAI